MIIYRTQEHRGSGTHRTWYEYRLEGDEVVRYKCSRWKFFDGDENNWETEETVVDSWSLNDPDMPDWLHQYL